jgi:formyl-CoA transferase
MRDRAAMAASIADLYRIAAEEILPGRTTAEWRALLAELDIPSAPVLTLEALEDDPHLKAVGLFEDYDHPAQGRLRRTRAPFRMEGVERGPDRHPPSLGEHSLEVLREIGLSETQIEALARRGLLKAPDEAPAPGPAGDG